MDEQPSRGPAAAASLVSSTTGAITWALGHYAFNGGIPPEIYGFVQLAVPAIAGWAGACVAHWRQRRAERAARVAPGPQEDTQGPPPDEPAGAV